MKENAGGMEPAGEGWFVVNARDSVWWRNETFGWGTVFESEENGFKEFGINVQVLEPGQPNCLYHRENQQEDFLVLSGECLLLVEEEERPLKAWDFVHCPPGTNHVFVGAGDKPCAILMVGSRSRNEELVYPASELAQRHGAGAQEETPEPRVAYGPYPKSERKRLNLTGLPWLTS